jgi:hypothetical protein
MSRLLWQEKTSYNLNPIYLKEKVEGSYELPAYYVNLAPTP